VAALMEQGPAELQEVAQDGMRVRASAGAKSYRREKSLAEWANAGVRNWGLARAAVRGLEKVRAVALPFAVAHDFRQTLLLRSWLAAA